MVMIMNIEEIRTFVSTARLGGFTLAASQLHRSQPAISRRIALMEDALGAPLMERARGQVKLTAAGHAFLPHAEAVLAAIQDGKDTLQAATSKESGSVSLAIVGTLADTHVVEILRKFARRSSVADLSLRTATSQEVSDLVRRGDATLGLRYVADTQGGLEADIVGHEELRVIAAADHPLKARRLGPADIARQRWIGFPVQRGRESSGAI